MAMSHAEYIFFSFLATLVPLIVEEISGEQR